MNKKGADVSITFIVLAAIALIVLVLIILFFTGSFKTLIGSQSDLVKGTVGDDQINIWKSQCDLYCTLGQKDIYCTKVFKYEFGEGDSKQTYCYVCDIGNTGNTDTTDCTTTGKNLAVKCSDIKC